MEREGAAVTCDGRLFHRRAAATGNALSLTVDRRVRRTSRDVDEAERIVVCLISTRTSAVAVIADRNAHGVRYSYRPRLK